MHTTYKIILAAGATLTLAACGGLSEATSDSDPVADAVRVAAAPTTTQPPDDGVTLTLADIDLGLLVLEDQCFNTAGALMEVELQMAIPDDDVREHAVGTYTLIYQIVGGEGGAETFNADIEGARYSTEQHLISTARCGQHLTVLPMQLIER